MEVEMEIEGEDGSKLAIGPQKTLFGRGSGFHTKDRTVSRRHVCLQVTETETEGGGRVSFEVIGRNPIWVCSQKDQSLKLFRKFEKGLLEFGDRFSLSAKSPVWFHLNNNQVAVAELLSKSDTDTEASSSRVDLHIDLSKIDPVKEFGFLVIGHEFDQYPKGKIRAVKDWEWFLDEPSKDSDDDEEEEEEEEEEEDKGKERRKMKKKRKKGKDNDDDDEEWGGESEDDKDIVAKLRKGKRPGYSTRSKDSGKGPNRGTKGGSSSSTSSTKQKKTTEDVDEDDETLGGFIVEDEEDDDKEENDDEEDEEEFEDDEDDDE